MAILSLKLLCISMFIILKVASCSPTCKEVTFEIEASAEHILWQNAPDLDDELGHVRFLGDALGLGPPPIQTGTQRVEGVFTLAGTYCAPADGNEGSIEMGDQSPILDSISDNNTDVLQLLISGNGFNKESWNCYGYDERCSWTKYATSSGYHTLAIDRLGTGKSEHPEDTVSTMQTGIQIEITHQLIRALRAGSDALGGKTFGKIVLGGYSYGSLLGYAVSRLYPTDLDALVLTGFSGRLFLPPSVLKMHFIPARHVTQKPQYADLPIGYLTAATEGTSTSSLYHGLWDPELSRVDWENRDVATVGEYASIGIALEGASDFTGPVMVVAGDFDDIFCHERNGPCAESLAAAKEMFPKLDPESFSYFVAPNTGHGVLAHDSAPEIHAAVHKWLDEMV